MANTQQRSEKLVERTYGRLLQQWRHERGLSQERLAELSGCDRSYLSRLERGINAPSLTVVVEIGTALGLQPSQVFAAIGTELDLVLGVASIRPDRV